MNTSYLANEIANAERLTARGSAFGLAFLRSGACTLPPSWYEALAAVLTARADGYEIDEAQAVTLTATTAIPGLWSCAGDADVHVDLARVWFVGVRLSAQMYQLTRT